MIMIIMIMIRSFIIRLVHSLVVITVIKAERGERRGGRGEVGSAPPACPAPGAAQLTRVVREVFCEPGVLHLPAQSSREKSWRPSLPAEKRPTSIAEYRGDGESARTPCGKSSEILAREIPLPVSPKDSGSSLARALGLAGRAAEICSPRQRLNGYLAQWVPSLSLASSFRNSLHCALLKRMFPGRTR